MGRRGNRIFPREMMMKSFKLNITSIRDISFVLSKTLGNLPELRAKPADWAELVSAMGVQVLPEREMVQRKVEEAAHCIVFEAAHNLKRHTTKAAVEDGASRERVVFLFKSGKVILTPGEGERRSDTMWLEVEFNNDVYHLAVIMLADLYRRVPGALRLLEAAVADSVEKYKGNPVFQ